MALTVPERPLDRTHLALLGTALEHLIAVPTLRLTEVLTEPLIGVENPEITVQDREVAWRGVEIGRRMGVHHTTQRLRGRARPLVLPIDNSNSLTSPREAD
jgi:hypothetical protein